MYSARSHPITFCQSGGEGRQQSLPLRPLLKAALPVDMAESTDLDKAATPEIGSAWAWSSVRKGSLALATIRVGKRIFCEGGLPNPAASSGNEADPLSSVSRGWLDRLCRAAAGVFAYRRTECRTMTQDPTKNGGQGGIRTLGTLSRTHAFQACALNHSATCPLAFAPGEEQIVGTARYIPMNFCRSTQI